MTYAEKLKDPRWQKKRLEILDRDHFTCQCCTDKTKTLCVHHKSYTGEPWEVENSELITYCIDCHSLIEYIKEMDDYNEIKKIVKKELSGAILYIVYVNKDTILLFAIQYGVVSYRITLCENHINTIKNFIDGNI
jgi:hypothetical protein